MVSFSLLNSVGGNQLSKSWATWERSVNRVHFHLCAALATWVSDTRPRVHSVAVGRPKTSMM